MGLPHIYVKNNALFQKNGASLPLLMRTLKKHGIAEDVKTQLE
jgi:hypothetical protein